MRVENVTFITGNPNKLAQFERYVNHPVAHKDIDLPEIQPDASLPVKEQLEQVVDQKAKDAYAILNSAVLIEDVALEIPEQKGWPGVNVKYELKTIGVEGICVVANMKEDTSATAHVMYGYYDGVKVEVFHGYVDGKITEYPSDESAIGFGWDRGFIPNGYNKTRAEMTEEEYDATSPRGNAAIKLVTFLRS